MGGMAEHNQAFIDGQNLYMGTTGASESWKLDLRRFRVHLKQKYRVDEAYYFLGAYDPDEQALYDDLQRYGYILRFREHTPKMTAHKKGNVDTDIVFLIMYKIYKKEIADGVVLVAGVGIVMVSRQRILLRSSWGLLIGVRLARNGASKTIF